MGFASVRELAASLEDGSEWTSWFHKNTGPSGAGAGRWVDMSMGAGTPKYNAYVGSQTTSTPLIGSGNDGIYLGPNPPPNQSRHLNSIQLATTGAASAPSTWMLCDYVMFYPLVDGDDTAIQLMDNFLPLPRYTSGEGVQMMMVGTTPGTVNVTGSVTYTNSLGVTGKVTTFGLFFNPITGCIVNGLNNVGASISPFISLGAGCKGVRSVESITLDGSMGGFFALVLVKPITTVVQRENRTVTEMSSLMQRANLPTIPDGAYLNWIANSAVSATPHPIRGHLQFVWR